MANYNIGICKIEYFALYAARTTSSWLIVLACIDRFFHSSASLRIRRMSSLKTTKIAIGITSITVFIVHCHMIVYYEITIGRDRFGNISPSCSGQKGIYSTFLGLWNMLLYSLCPCLLIFLFGLLTLNNLRQHRRAIPVAVEINRIARRTDTQLLRMLSAQVLVIIIATLPLSIL
jgi:glucan phosphoethanolaminetransferase (alkaline phosphatase superfamily)